MTDNHDYLRTSDPNFRLKADVLALMMRGAGYAAVFCLVLLLLALALRSLGLALPERSREAPDPTPMTLLVAPADHRLT